MITDSIRCKLRECNSRERQVNELKCNTPICDGQDICIPVYYTPSNLQPSVCLIIFSINQNVCFF
jgi:hypothetical protein